MRKSRKCDFRGRSCEYLNSLVLFIYVWSPPRLKIWRRRKVRVASRWTRNRLENCQIWFNSTIWRKQFWFETLFLSLPNKHKTPSFAAAQSSETLQEGWNLHEVCRKSLQWIAAFRVTSCFSWCGTVLALFWLLSIPSNSCQFIHRRFWSPTSGVELKSNRHTAGQLLQRLIWEWCVASLFWFIFVIYIFWFRFPSELAKLCASLGRVAQAR